MIKNFIENNPLKSKDFSQEIHHWVARTIGGVIVADGRIHPEERKFLRDLLEGLKVDQESYDIITKIITSKEHPTITPIEVTPRQAEQIFRYVLEVCACDHELQPKEIRYLRLAGRALGLQDVEMNDLILNTEKKLRREFLDTLLENLLPNERQWLAGAILKAVYADGRVDRKEISYLGNVHELLEDNPDLLNSVKMSPRDFSLNLLPKVFFDPHLSERILKLLIEICLSDDDFHPVERKVIQEIAQSLNFPGEALDLLIEKSHTQWNILLGR